MISYSSTCQFCPDLSRCFPRPAVVRAVDRLRPVVDTTPPEVRQVLESSQNTIALLLLVLSHYIITHIIGIIIFVLGTAVLLGLDRRLHSHADARVRVLPESRKVTRCNDGLECLTRLYCSGSQATVAACFQSLAVSRTHGRLKRS